MKKVVVLAVVSLLLIAGSQAVACVGKVLTIGVPDNLQEQLLAELVSVLVSERTGTAVKIVTYRNAGELYTAVRQGQVGLIIENTDRALGLLKHKDSDGKGALEMVKKEYRANLNLVWLQPFGSVAARSGNQIVAPVIAQDVLGNLPALPKLINKLSGILNDAAFQKLAKGVKPDEKPKKAARDLLKAKKLI